MTSHPWTTDGTYLPAGYGLTRVPLKGRDKRNKICSEFLIKSRIEFDKWLADLSEINNLFWRKQHGEKKRKGKLEVDLVCHHANMRQKGVRTTNTK